MTPPACLKGGFMSRRLALFLIAVMILWTVYGCAAVNAAVKDYMLGNSDAEIHSQIEKNSQLITQFLTAVLPKGNPLLTGGIVFVGSAISFFTGVILARKKKEDKHDVS